MRSASPCRGNFSPLGSTASASMACATAGNASSPTTFCGWRRNAAWQLGREVCCACRALYRGLDKDGNPDLGQRLGHLGGALETGGGAEGGGAGEEREEGVVRG